MPKKRSGSGVIALAMTIPLLASATAHAQPAHGKPKARLGLLSSVDAVIPGRAFDVGIHLIIDPGWHTYWSKRGDSGRAPKVTWTLPDGFTAGDLEFPAPKRYTYREVITSNILDGEPVLLARLTPPGAVSEARVAIAANVNYLVCSSDEKAQCLEESADLRLDLPVRPGGDANLANVELFKRAQEALPKTHSPYVTVTPSTTAVDFSTGKAFEMLLTIDIARGYRVPSPGPLAETEVFVRPAPGIMVTEPVYPKPQVRIDPVLGELNEYTGQVVVRIPAEIGEESPAGPVRLAGIVKCRPYTDDGRWLTPEALAFSLPLVGTGGAPIAADAGVRGTAGTATLSLPEQAPASGFLGRLGTVGLLIGCFLYGLFLNATPCVLPLLSIKILGFVQQAHESRRRTLILGLAFGVGVMLFFVILGFLAAAGTNVLQYPAAVIALSAVVMALALAMLGVYTLQAPSGAVKLEARIHPEGLLSSFGKGALAPVLGFACTGPLLFGVWGWATQQPAQTAVFAFLFAGLGMASPYMLLGANPNWLSFLPKPGPWMITFERIMGFLLLAMVIWLLSPLVTQIGAGGLQWTLIFFVAIGMGCWLLGRIQATMSAPLRWRYRGGAAAIVAGAGVLVYGWIYPLGEATARQQELKEGSDAAYGVPYQPWSPEAVERTVRSGKVVFVDFTAAYCTVCKANKRLAINTPEVHDKMEALGVVVFRGDFTFADPRIREVLRKHGRAGVPLNLIYPPGKLDAPIVLRPNLTREYLLQKLDEAAR